MLVIRDQQIVAFASAAQHLFCAQLSRDIRLVLPDKVRGLSLESLYAAVSDRVHQATSFGLSDRYDIRRYVECSYVLGWAEAGPPVKARGVLEDADLSPEERMDRIEQWTEHL